MKKTLMIIIVISLACWAVGCTNSAEENNKTTTNNYYPPTPTNPCPDGQVPVVLWHDSDGDDLAEPGSTITVCLAPTDPAPDGWTDVPPPPWDPCPEDPANQCGISVPNIQITAMANGHTVAITANPSYTAGTVSRVVFYSGVVEIGTDIVGTDGWSYNWANVLAGTYTISAVMYTNDGKTATSNSVTVTIDNGQCVPTMRCSWAYNTPSNVNYFNGISTSCYASWDGQDPNWQWSTFRSCHDASNGCVIEDEVFSDAINAGRCEFNNVVPQGMNGNPENPFGEDLGYFINWALSPDGNGGAYNALATGYPTCYINPDCTDYAQVPVVYICHPWGCNYLVDFTGTVNPITGNTVNVFINTYIDSDGDGYPNACETGTSCVPDNCIRYANTNQSVNPCTDPNTPAEYRDSDNDWYLDGEDLYPYDRTRH